MYIGWFQLISGRRQIKKYFFFFHTIQRGGISIHLKAVYDDTALVTKNYVVYASSNAYSSSFQMSLNYSSYANVMKTVYFVSQPFCQRFCGVNVLCSCGYFALISQRIEGICSHSMCQRVSCVPLSVAPVTTKFDVKKKITSEIKFLLVLGKVVVKKSRQTQFITPVPLDKRIATPE